MFENYNGTILVNDKEVSDFNFKALTGSVCIKLRPNTVIQSDGAGNNPQTDVNEMQTYKITVKQYMTKPSEPGFDFMAKWNNNKPMPLRTMVGEKLKETRGMVYMYLRGKGLETVTCMRCGRTLTHPISRHYGIGPECMSKLGIAADIEDVNEIKEKLTDISWEGWIIKKAIEEEELYNE